MRLHLHEWGEPDDPLLVCLHGITAHGLRFRRLGEERLAARFRVVAPDLRGHGRSSFEPPWSIDAHLGDLEDTFGDRRAIWVGHSFGGRLIAELASRHPDRVDRAVLLDPSLRVLPHVALNLAEEELKDASFASVDEAVAARVDSGRFPLTPREQLEAEMSEHLELSPDGRLRSRYCRSAVVAAWSELATPPRLYRGVPTLLVTGAESWLVLDEDVEALRHELGDLLEVTTVPGGHTVYWDAFEETASAIERFLA